MVSGKTTSGAPIWPGKGDPTAQAVAALAEAVQASLKRQAAVYEQLGIILESLAVVQRGFISLGELMRSIEQALVGLQGEVRATGAKVQQLLDRQGPPA
jgi:hypothetical protein